MTISKVVISQRSVIIHFQILLWTALMILPCIQFLKACNAALLSVSIVAFAVSINLGHFSVHPLVAEVILCFHVPEPVPQM
jgi:hypothetical protein